MVNDSVIMGKKYNECILITFHGRNIIIFDIDLLKTTHGSVTNLSKQCNEFLPGDIT